MCNCLLFFHGMSCFEGDVRARDVKNMTHYSKWTSSVVNRHGSSGAALRRGDCERIISFSLSAENVAGLWCLPAQRCLLQVATCNSSCV